MKYFFLTMAILGIIGCFCGHTHLFWIVIMSLAMSTAIHFDDRKAKKTDFFD